MFNDITCKVRKDMLCLTIPLARKEGYVMFNDTTCKVGRKDMLCLAILLAR